MGEKTHTIHGRSLDCVRCDVVEDIPRLPLARNVGREDLRLEWKDWTEVTGCL